MPRTTPPTTPWDDWRAIAFTMLGWPPSEFWAATPHDLVAACDAQKLMATGLSPTTLASLRNKLNELR